MAAEINAHNPIATPIWKSVHPNSRMRVGMTTGNANHPMPVATSMQRKLAAATYHP
jgi:hypothetical protein